MIRILLSIFLIFMMNSSFAEATGKPLTADKAFSVSSHINQNHQLVLDWKIAPDYFLYKDKIAISLPENSNATLGKIDMPPGEARQDEVHGNYQVYVNGMSIPVEIQSQQKILTVNVRYQGCSKQGFCYPPIKKSLEVNLAAAPTNGPALATASDQDLAAKIFDGKNFFVIILSFLGLGILMAFTPCVLPMVPILSGIIVGQGKNISTTKAFFLSLAYVMGMAITYAAAGIAVASLGGSVQAMMQKPWVIIAFSGLFVLLALSMFNIYEIRLPNAFQQRVNSMSNQLQGGAYVSVFFMGALSTLIVSPCVSAPLVGVLGFIGQTGDLFLGGTALLALGFGMGLPLLIIGASAGKFLPKAGMWMEMIKELFGFLMLGFAIWMLSRVISGSVILYLWGALFIFAAVYYTFISKASGDFKKTSRVLSSVVLIYGVVMVVGAAKGGSEFFHPFTAPEMIAENKLPFVVVKNEAEFAKQLAKAKRESKVVMLDFYADWCTSCVLLDKHVFSQAMIKKALSNVLLLRADVTANNNFDQALLKRFQVIAPPTILFFNPEGKELTQARIVGEVDDKKFLARLTTIKGFESANQE